VLADAVFYVDNDRTSLRNFSFQNFFRFIIIYDRYLDAMKILRMLNSKSTSMYSIMFLALCFLIVGVYSFSPIPTLSGNASAGFCSAFIHHESHITRSPFSKKLHQIKTGTPSSLTDVDSDVAETDAFSGLIKESDPPHSRKKFITTNSTIVLPFSAAVAFDAFSDLPRQASWSPWLHSVSYVNEGLRAAEPETEWKMKLLGFTYRWRAVSTKLHRPYLIEWVSTSGMRNSGKVKFEPLVLESENEEHCKMTLSMSFIAPRPVAVMFQRSNRLESLFREIILKKTLSLFSEVVASEDLNKELI